MVNAVISIPIKIIELLGDLLKFLFIPQDGWFDSKVDSLKARFNIIESVHQTVQVFINFFSNNDFGEPPTITVNFSSSQGLDYGVSGKAIDFSWYEPFKPTVDILVSSILWVVFSWNTFKDLPSIIGGVSSVATSTANISKEVSKDD